MAQTKLNQAWRAFSAAIRTHEEALYARTTDRKCANCKKQPARWDSIYCSTACQRAFLTFKEGK